MSVETLVLTQTEIPQLLLLVFPFPCRQREEEIFDNQDVWIGTFSQAA